jgi:hypothetical protein
LSAMLVSLLPRRHDAGITLPEKPYRVAGDSQRVTTAGSAGSC